MSLVEVGGSCDGAFAAVRDAFAGNFSEGEIGAACAVEVDGRTVVDLWGGWADEDRSRPWQDDTFVNAYSVGKPIVALAVLQLVAAGELELDEPAARWWPELIAGQRGATVRDVLCHRAGVPAIRQPLTNDALWDWDTMCRRGRRDTNRGGHPGAGTATTSTPTASSPVSSRAVSLAACPGIGCATKSPARSAADLAWGLPPSAADPLCRRRLAVPM